MAHGGKDDAPPPRTGNASGNKSVAPTTELVAAPVSTGVLRENENHDSSPKSEKRTRMHHIERHRSCVVTLSDIELNGLQPHCLQQTIEISKIPRGGSQCSLHEETPTDTNASNRYAIADAAWEALKRSIVYFRGQPIGTVAAIDKSQGEALNYDQVFMRDFIPSALAFLMKGEHLIVKNFLVETARLQSREKMVDLFKLGQGVMPASFKVHHRNPTQKTESLLADFGETAIGRVAPVDSGLRWIILLRAYTKWTGDNSLAESPNCQRAMHLILRLCLSEGCDTSPALLRADGCSMIDRRMGIYGYPIEIQALFFMAMRCALSLLKQDSDADFVNHITKRIQALSYHLHSHYWLDIQRLNDIYRYKTEEYSQTALNKFNVIPESIPDWIFDFMPSRGGYFIGNVSPARMDFRWFCLGNFIAILSSLATGEQAEAILDVVEERWQVVTDSKITELTDDENHDSPPKPEKRTRMHHIERHRSCVVILSDIELNGLHPRHLLQTIEINKSAGGSQCSLHEEIPTDTNASHRHAISDATLEALKRSIVYFSGQLIGTVAAIYKSQGAALNYDQVFMRKLTPSALAFLMKEIARLRSSDNMVDLFELHHRYSTQNTESLLYDLGETAIGRAAPADSGLWWIILLHAYTKWAGDNSLAESPDCQTAMHHILGFGLSEGCDTSPALLCAAGCSMIDRRMGIFGYPIEFQARFFMAIADAPWEVIKRSIVYFKGRPIRTVAAIDKPQGAAFNYGTDGSSSLNTATVCLDGSDEEVLASYRRAIGRIRWYSKTKGKCVDLSRIFGPNVEAFTTAEDGTFYVTLQYKNRYLTLCLKARNLYTMGWRSDHGTFEIRLENEESYMVGKDITVVKCSKNYSALSPDGKVSLTRLGPKAVRDAFEVLFKCRGEPSREVKQAIGRYAVMFSEAARLQSVLNTVCLSYSDPNFYECQLDNTRYENNSFWIRRYSHYSGELMVQINDLKTGQIPGPIRNKGDDDISSRIEILREIRTLLLDARYFEEGEFKHEPAPKMTEEPLIKKHHPMSDTEADTFPASILNDLPEAAELERRCEAELERISEMKEKQAQQATSNSINNKFGEFLDHFPAVKRRFTTLRTSSVSSTTDSLLLPQMLAHPLPLQKAHAPTVQRVYAPPHIEKLQAPSVLRLQPPAQPQRIHSLQPNLARATRFVGRIIRFVH